MNEIFFQIILYNNEQNNVYPILLNNTSVESGTTLTAFRGFSVADLMGFNILGADSIGAIISGG